MQQYPSCHNIRAQHTVCDVSQSIVGFFISLSQINPEESSQLKLLCPVHLSLRETAADTVKTVKERRDKQHKSLGRVFLGPFILSGRIKEGGERCDVDALSVSQRPD